MAIVPNLNGVPISPATPLFDPHNPTLNELQHDEAEAAIAAGAFGALLQDTATRSAAMTLLAITQGDVSGLVAALAGKAASVHTHVAADVTDFSAAVLALAAAIVHNHNASAINAGTLDIARIPNIPYANVTGTPTISAYGATLIDDADAATARTTLGIGSEASAAEFLAGTNTTNFISSRRLNDASIPVPVAYASTITLDGSTGRNFIVGVLTNSPTLANPTNFVVGQEGKITFTQDASGSKAITLGSNWKMHGATRLNAAANAVTLWNYYVETATIIRVVPNIGGF